MSGDPRFQLSGRNTRYQRIMQNSSIVASGSTYLVFNLGGLGAKSITATFKTSAIAYIGLAFADYNGNPASGSGSIVQSTTSGSPTGGVTIAEYGGAPYIMVIVYDKSGAANTIQYVDLYWTTN